MSFKTVGKRDDLALGKVKAIALEGRLVALCRVGTSEFYAVEDRCSHDNAPLGEGLLEDHQIECPRHGARFDVRSGAVTCLPAVTPIKAFAVRVVGEEVQISLEEPHV